MDKKLKRIIKREAYIVFAAMVVSIALVWIAVPTGHHFEYFTKIFLKNPYPYFDNKMSALLFGAGVRLAFIYYPLYLLIRFIRILRKNYENTKRH